MANNLEIFPDRLTGKERAVQCNSKHSSNLSLVVHTTYWRFFGFLFGHCPGSQRGILESSKVPIDDETRRYLFYIHDPCDVDK